MQDFHAVADLVQGDIFFREMPLGGVLAGYSNPGTGRGIGKPLAFRPLLCSFKTAAAQSAEYEMAVEKLLICPERGFVLHERLLYQTKIRAQLAAQ